MSVVKPGRVFCFTLFEVDEEPVFPVGVEYVYQLEKCGDTGRLHFQGYCRFPKVMLLTGLKKIFPNAHWENRKGTHHDAFVYCTKEDTRVKEPVMNMKEVPYSGKRVDLNDAAERIRNHVSWADCLNDEELTSVLAKYTKWSRDVFNHKPITPVEGVVLRKWQLSLVQQVSEYPDPRKIIWVHDSIGNKGKSFLATFLARNMGALVVSSAKSADIAYVYHGQSIVAWDLSRSQEEHVNYGCMEDIKNGRIFSPKYEVTVKIFPIPHVVVFANFHCPQGKFSADRIRELDLDEKFTLSIEPSSHANVFSCAYNYNL